jgi:putative iron-only hydrogenase system regulator
MEKRIGTITILIVDRSKSAEINTIISEFSDLVLCRQGLPFHDRPVAVISLIVEGQPDKINALTGKLGRLEGVETKAVLTKNQQ